MKKIFLLGILGLGLTLPVLGMDKKGVNLNNTNFRNPSLDKTSDEEIIVTRRQGALVVTGRTTEQLTTAFKAGMAELGDDLEKQHRRQKKPSGRTSPDIKRVKRIYKAQPKNSLPKEQAPPIIIISSAGELDDEDREDIQELLEALDSIN